MKYLVGILFAVSTLNGIAQAPVINNISPLTVGPTLKVVVTGSGFNTTASQNVVWFDHVRGTVTAATAYSLEVQVPAQARFSNVEVVNLGNNTSAKSPMKLLPSYGGVSLPDVPPFTPATPVLAPYTDSNELFDVASSDLDMDGDPDLVTTKGGPTSTATISDLYVFQNANSGVGTVSFTRTSVPITLGGPTANVACGDLNGDGKPDIVASRGGATRNEVFVLKNTNTTPGTLAFTSQAKLVLDATHLSFRVVIRDLNADGKPEVVVTNSYSDPLHPEIPNVIYIFPNQSTLTTISFGSPLKLTVTGAVTTYGLEVQDLDGDGKPEIIVNQFQKPDVFIFRNTSSGNLNFDPVLQLPTKGGFIQIISADLNDDGLLDLVATSIGSGPGTSGIQMWINKSTSGNIAFDVSLSFPADDGAWGIDAGDIDGDGDEDIWVSCKDGGAIDILRQDGPLNFTPLKIVLSGGYGPRNLRIGDFDGDAKPDIAYTAKPQVGLQNTLSILRNNNCWNPVITGSSKTICTGQTIPLQITPAFGVTYDWKLDGTSQTLLATPYLFNATTAGTYTVTLTGTSDASCVNTTPGYVLAPDVNTFPSDPSIGNNVPCLGSSLNLTTAAVANATYQWNGPNGFSSTSQNPVITPVAFESAGNYTLQITLTNGCQSNLVKKILDVASVPVLPVTASPSLTACVGGAITLTVPNSAGYTYQWNKAGAAITGQTTSTLSFPSLAATDEADYSVSVTSTANTCTQETGKASVNVFSTPVAAFTFSGTQCIGSTITYTDQSTKDSRATLTYAWALGDGTTSTDQSPTHPYKTASNFAVSLAVSYSGSCSNSTNQSVKINSPVVPVIATTASAICSGDQITLSVAGTFNSMTWGGVTGTGASVVITVAGKYTVSTIDANGCASKDSLTISAKPLITPFAAISKRASINVGDTTQLVATAGADTYLWTPGKLLSTDSTIANPIAKPTTTTVYIVVAKKAGSCDASDTVTVKVDIGSASIKPPVIFTPNNDGKNDNWKLCQLPPGSVGACAEESVYSEWTMTIFDGHGSQVYQQKGFSSWDGNYNGSPSPNGTYFYVFSNSKDKPATGTVLLVR
jgi:gliding motility-associated-like protein